MSTILVGQMVGQIRIMTGKLSARTVETVTEPGRYSDGNGLYLVVREGGSRQWFLFYRYGGKRRELGLGGAGKGGVSPDCLLVSWLVRLAGDEEIPSQDGSEGDVL